jgi:hypothetical protein
MKVETPFFQFYEFVLFLVSFVMHTAKASCLYPILNLQTSVFGRRKNTIKNDNSTKFAIVYKRVCTTVFYVVNLCNNN